MLPTIEDTCSHPEIMSTRPRSKSPSPCRSCKKKWRLRSSAESATKREEGNIVRNVVHCAYVVLHSVEYVYEGSQEAEEIRPNTEYGPIGWAISG